MLANDTWQPIRVPLRAPAAGELSTEFGPVQEWFDRLRRAASGSRTPAFRLETRSVGGRLVGANEVPCAAWFDEPGQAWRLLGVEADVASFARLYAASLAAEDDVAEWVRHHPLRALSHASDWPQLMATARWLREHLGTGMYLRQIDVPGVDTKFIERYRPLLADLIDVLAPGAADESRSTGKQFARRYGFSDKPALTRVRSLDGYPVLTGSGGSGVTDAVLRVDELAHLEMPATRVLVVENEITYLALPHVPDAVAFFGSGFDVLRLGRLAWLADRDVVYWGDLDTDGFVILDRLRSLLPPVRSLLMDIDTLLAHQSQWTTDPTPARIELDRLTGAEQGVFRQLRDNTLGTSVRLEQERIGYDRVVEALSKAWV